MKVISSDAVIEFLEELKDYLPSEDGKLPETFFTKNGIDDAIQAIREESIDINWHLKEDYQNDQT